MKKKLQLLLVMSMLFIGNHSFAQSNDSTKTYLDLVVNLVGTNLNYGDNNSSVRDYKKSLLGGQLGVSFQGGITPNFSLVGELYFSMKGGKLKEGNPMTTGESTLRLYGFEMPVLARFHFNGFHINAGPSVAYNFKGTQKISDVSKDLDYKEFEAGLQMGGGYTFKTPKRRITLDLRYNYGLTNISNQDEIHNRSFIVSLHMSKAWKKNLLAR